MDVCVDGKHVCGLELCDDHSRRQFYDILYARSVTKEVDFGKYESNAPETETEKALIDEWIAISEEIHFDDFVIGRYVTDDRVIMAIAYKLGISFMSASSLLSEYEDVYDGCTTRQRQHCICGKRSKLYPIINKNTKRVLLVGSTCIKTVSMVSISSSRCVQCGASTKEIDTRYGRCADCVHDPHFVLGSHEGKSIIMTAVGDNIVSNCIKDDKDYYDMVIMTADSVRMAMKGTLPNITRRINRPPNPTDKLGKTTFTFGKHTGKCYFDVYHSDYNYVKWARAQKDPSDNLIDFNHYTTMMDTTTTTPATTCPSDVASSSNQLQNGRVRLPKR